MPSQLNNTMLQSICVRTLKSSNANEVLDFAMSGSEPFQAYLDVLKTARALEFTSSGFIICFDWGDYFMRFDMKTYVKSTIMHVLSHVPEVIINDAEQTHLEIIRDWHNYENLESIILRGVEGDSLQEAIVSQILQIPVKRFTVAASCIVPFITTLDTREYDYFEVIFDSGYYFDTLETVLMNYRVHSKDAKITFTGEYTWYEILYVFSKVVDAKEDSISSVVENLSIHCDGDIDVPAQSAYDLTEFFQDLQTGFPNLKKVDFCLDFTNNSENLMTVEEVSAEFYTNLRNEVTKQIADTNIGYDLNVEWIREDHIIDISEENAHFTSLSDALGKNLGFHKTDSQIDSCTWEMEEKIAPNKHLKMKITLIEPNFEDYELHQEILQDAGIYYDDEDEYDYNSDYDDVEDFGEEYGYDY